MGEDVTTLWKFPTSNKIHTTLHCRYVKHWQAKNAEQFERDQPEDVQNKDRCAGCW